MSKDETELELQLVRLLHSAARRYCREQHAYWAGVYSEIYESGSWRLQAKDGGWKYSDKAWDTFPRYNVLGAILSLIEARLPDELGDLAQARGALANAAYAAQDPLTGTTENLIAIEAMDQERDLFAAFVDLIDEADLWEQPPPLPLRRTLSRAEMQSHWDELEARWMVKGYWIPLVEVSLRDPVVVVDAQDFGKCVERRALIKALQKRGVHHLYELREHDLEPSYFQDVELLTPNYTGAEGFWFPQGKDWLLYASHESSLTLAGDLIVEVIEEIWPNYVSHSWPGSSFI